MGSAHWDDISFERAFHNIPKTLIDHEWRLSMIASVLVCLRYHPGGSIRSALEGQIRLRNPTVMKAFSKYQVKYFASLYEVVESIHHFLDGRLPIPPVDIEYVDVRRPQLLQAGFNADMHRLYIVSDIQRLLLDPGFPMHVICGVLALGSARRHSSS